MRNNRRNFLCTLGAPFLRAAQQRKTNIVWIMADDMGWGDPGCYGQRYIQLT